MAYTDIDKPSDYFNTLLYTGNNANRSFTGVGFQPDLTWVKARNNTTWHLLYDAVRTAGTGKELHSNSTQAEGASNSSLYGYLSSFNSDGFSTVNGSSSSDALNETNRTYAAWNWKAGTSFSNDASSTSVGTIDSTGSVSTDAGFSIINYAGTGNAGTIAHGLGAVLKMIIFKNRSTEEDWGVWHQGFPNNGYIALNTANNQRTNNTFMNNTIPTSSVFSVGNNTRTGSNSHNFVAYCFAEKQGYSKFGSYTGNGNANGTFVYTGFKPAFILFKCADTNSTNWVLYDSKRNGYNGSNLALYADTNQADDSGNEPDILSNGFKHTGTGNDRNGSGNAYIYMAFAENPFTTSTGVPATAR